MLGESINNIKSWKARDRWNEQLNIKSSKRGASKGNKNAVGNKGGGAEKGNLNAMKHGNYIPESRFESKKFLAKYLPKVTQNIIEDIHNSGVNALDILWINIEIQFSTLLRSQKIMHVKNNKDMTKEVKKLKTFYGEESSSEETEWEIQFAWDKQERFVTAQSKGMQVLLNMIKSYDEMLNKNWDIATEQQKIRIEILKSDLKQVTQDHEKVVVFAGEDELED